MYPRSTLRVLAALTGTLAAALSVTVLYYHARGAVGYVAVASVVALATLLLLSRGSLLTLRRRTARLENCLTLVEMAENLAGLGRWRYDPVTGTQSWSRQLCRLFGLPFRSDLTEAERRALLPDSGAALFASLAHHMHDETPYTLEFEIVRPEGEERLIRMVATNLFDQRGEIQEMFGVAMDVTADYKRVREADEARIVALGEAARAQQLAATDALTGLANRRALMGALDRAILDARAQQAPLSLAIFDLDHFKAVNDVYGHPAGDRVLCQVASAGNAHVREGDTLARIGGEEFAWLMLGADDETACRAANGLRASIASGTGGDGVPPVTASLGHAALQRGDTALTLLARADEALYAAKEGGRNRVRMAA